eukprot:5380469-Prymnesium_polylepis.1
MRAHRPQERPHHGEHPAGDPAVVEGAAEGQRVLHPAAAQEALLDAPLPLELGGSHRFERSADCSKLHRVAQAAEDEKAAARHATGDTPQRAGVGHESGHVDHLLRSGA